MITRKFIQAALTLFLIVSWAAEILPSALHTYHTSLTRIDYNQKENLAEITIQLFTHDLAPMLERRLKKQVDLEKTSEVDKEILNYLNENFILSDLSGNTKQLRWVGKEVEVDTVYIYLEFPTEESFEGYKLKNTIFFESFPEQTNLVIARFNGKKSDLLFKVGDKFKEIKQSETSSEK